MSKQTYFVVLPFVVGKKGRIIEGEPRLVASGVQAIRTAQQMAGRVAGAVAFSRTGDSETGDYEDAVILTVVGKVPGDVLEVGVANLPNDEVAA